jgi:hypothetical protein
MHGLGRQFHSRFTLLSACDTREGELAGHAIHKQGHRVMLPSPVLTGRVNTVVTRDSDVDTGRCEQVCWVLLQTRL